MPPKDNEYFNFSKWKNSKIRQFFMVSKFFNLYFSLTPEFKSVLRIDMKDAVEYDDGRLNVASKFEGMDELFNIDFTMSEEALARMGDRDFFSLSMNNVNNGIEYGNVRAFFKTQVA